MWSMSQIGEGEIRYSPDEDFSEVYCFDLYIWLWNYSRPLLIIIQKHCVSAFGQVEPTRVKILFT